MTSLVNNEFANSFNAVTELVDWYELSDDRRASPMGGGWAGGDWSELFDAREAARAGEERTGGGIRGTSMFVPS